MESSKGSSRCSTVDFFSWEKKYSVGVRLIDIDHKNLFEIINTLHAGIKRGLSTSQIGIAIAGLARYVDEHFEREENLMREYCYPDLPKHREIHRDLIRKVHAVRKVQITQPEKIDPDKLMSFLKDWLANHILISDMDYVPYLHGEVPKADEQGNHVGEETLTETSAETKIELQSVSVKVPPQSAEVLYRCALLLRRGGDEAQAIAELTDPISSMTQEEAIQICASLLK